MYKMKRSSNTSNKVDRKKKLLSMDDQNHSTFIFSKRNFVVFDLLINCSRYTTVLMASKTLQCIYFNNFFFINLKFSANQLKWVYVKEKFLVNWTIFLYGLFASSPLSLSIYVKFSCLFLAVLMLSAWFRLIPTHCHEKWTNNNHSNQKRIV